MAVPRKQINQLIIKQTAKLAELMYVEYGRTTNEWLIIIQQSNVYELILDLRTHMWSEGLIYLQDNLITELKEKGVL